MNIADNIIRQKLINVYFIWGRGKTTISNELSKNFGFHIYDVDKNRYHHWKNTAEPQYQPYMCRDFEKEYGVKDFWELPPEVIHERETHWLQEFTPMAVIDLMLLSQSHEVILCEGDIDYGAILPIASHTVYLSNQGTKFDWFDRPDHYNALDSVKNRTDISNEEKDDIIRNARNTVGTNEGRIPGWVMENGIKYVIWNDAISVEQTAVEVAEYFGFNKEDKNRNE